MGRHLLAQYNVATLKAPLESAESADFRNALDAINALGEAQTGFVWRAKGEGFDSATPAPDQNPEYIVNLTVWEFCRSPCGLCLQDRASALCAKPRSLVPYALRAILRALVDP